MAYLLWRPRNSRAAALTGKCGDQSKRMHKQCFTYCTNNVSRTTAQNFVSYGASSIRFNRRPIYSNEKPAATAADTDRVQWQLVAVRYFSTSWKRIEVKLFLLRAGIATVHDTLRTYA